MALAKKCDRCGKLYELKDIGACESIANGLVLARRYKQNTRTFSYKYFDLCPECRISLAHWLKTANLEGILHYKSLIDLD